ncbi:MAG: LysM domain-containing protein [Chloroflexota bacterium]
MKKQRWTVPVLVTALLLLTAAVVSAATYIVQPGDTLWGISRQFNTSVDAIVQANNIPNPNLIYVGQVLEVPDGTGPSPTPVPPPVNPATYVVQPGDTLSQIAARFGTTVPALVAANNIVNPNLIYVGQVLVIPGGTGTPSPTPAPVPTTAPPAPITGFKFGGQTQTFANKQTMQDVGMEWVKIQYKWTPGDDPSILSGTIQDAHDSGFKILLSITGAEAYPPANGIDFNGFVQFLGGVAGYQPDAD